MVASACSSAAPASACRGWLSQRKLTIARQPRLDLPGIPQHVVQRGNDRQACFAAEVDYGQYLQREAAGKHGCTVLDEQQLAELRLHTWQQRTWDSDRFRQQIETLTRRAAGVRPRSRPCKLPIAPEK